MEEEARFGDAIEASMVLFHALRGEPLVGKTRRRTAPQEEWRLAQSTH